MAGDRQAPSGTGFDPAPQFRVHGVAGRQPPSVTGRCYFGPVKTGMTFDLHVAAGSDPREPGQCRLLVQEIFIAERPVDELDQVTSARLLLSGDVPPLLAQDSLLIAMSSPDASQWQLEDGLWRRTQDEPEETSQELSRARGTMEADRLQAVNIGGCINYPVRTPACTHRQGQARTAKRNRHVRTPPADPRPRLT